MTTSRSGARRPARTRATAPAPTGRIGAVRLAWVAERVWPLLWSAVLATVIVNVGLGRFVEWDESVFVSQSGGFAGLEVRPATLAASREIGPVYLIGLLRTVAVELASVRLLWAIVTVTVLVLAFHEVGRAIGRWQAVAAGIVFGTSWVVLLYSASFYASLLASCCSLGAVGIYLRIREHRGSSTVSLQLGLLFGLALVASLWLRQIETALVLIVLVGHSLAVQPAAVWRRNTVAVIGAVVVLALGFALPWAIDSTARYGSVSARLEAAQGQGWPTGLVNRAPDYVLGLLGESITYRPLGSLEGLLTAGRVLEAVTVAATLLLVALVTVRARRHTGAPPDRPRGHVRALFAALSSVSFAFFFFYASRTQDRYVMFGWVFASVLIGSGLAVAVPRVRSILGDRRAFVLFSVLLLMWVGSQLTVLRPYETRRIVDTAGTEGVAETVRTLAAGAPCRGVARYGAPQLQFGSGCVFQSVADTAEAEEALTTFSEESEPRFVVIPRPQAEGLPLPEGWSLDERELVTGNSVLIYSWIPEPPPGPDA